MQNKFDKSILLLHPPGWSVNYGAPHIALPLIQGYLKERGVMCYIKDLNIETANYYNLSIVKEDIDYFINNGFNEHKADKLYYSLVDKFEKIGNQYNGNWKIKSGFNFANCDLSKSDDIKKYSFKKSPFTKYYIDKVIPMIKNINPVIIGLSITVPSQLLSAFELIRIIRDSGYEGKIVLGGNTVTRIEKELQKDWVFNLIDFVITNQGEEPLELLYNKLIHNVYEYNEIPNLLWKNSKGEFIKNPYKSLKAKYFSTPDFEGYPIGKYWALNYLPIIGARGCYYGKCSFCPIPYAWGSNGFIGYDDSIKLIKYVENSIKKYQIHNFSFVEESMNAKKLLDFSKLVIKKGLKINFEGYVRFDKIWQNKEYLSIFKKAGLKKVFIGMELISSDKRTNMNKGDDIDDILNYLTLFNDFGIKVHLFTMFGYPGTKIDDAMDTIDFLLNHKNLIDTIDVSHFVYSKHTSVSEVLPIIKNEKDWALEYNYKGLNGNLSTKEAKFLANSLESLILAEVPKWLHPIYRMYSVWK